MDQLFCTGFRIVEFCFDKNSPHRFAEQRMNGNRFSIDSLANFSHRQTQEDGKQASVERLPRLYIFNIVMSDVSTFGTNLRI